MKHYKPLFWPQGGLPVGVDVRRKRECLWGLTEATGAWYRGWGGVVSMCTTLFVNPHIAPRATLSVGHNELPGWGQRP